MKQEDKDYQRELKEIRGFSGDIKKLFALLSGQYIFNSRGIQKYLNSRKQLSTFINNLIRLGIIDRPEKAGRSHRYKPRDVFMMLLAARYIQSGIPMKALTGALTHLADYELIDRLHRPELVDKEILKEKYIQWKKQKRKKADSIDDLYHQIRIDRGIVLQVKYGEYELDQIDDMKKMLEDYISGTSSYG